MEKIDFRFLIYRISRIITMTFSTTFLTFYALLLPENLNVLFSLGISEQLLL